MRIIAGELRHRLINMTNLDTTRETTDKVRGAIFNLIGQFFQGGVALDLFCGSGAMGIEAISRGIDFVYFNDLNYKALKVTKDNLNMLGILDKAYLTNLDYEKALASYDKPFDLIFLDPPYALDNVSYVIDLIEKNNLLNKNGLIVFEMAAITNTPLFCGRLRIIKERSYGIKKVLVLGE